MDDQKLFKRFIHENEMTLSVLEKDQKALTDPFKKAVRESYCLALKSAMIRAKSYLKIMQQDELDVAKISIKYEKVNKHIEEIGKVIDEYYGVYYLNERIGYAVLRSIDDKILHGFYGFNDQFWFNFVGNSKYINGEIGTGVSSRKELLVSVQDYVKSTQELIKQEND